MALTPSSLPCFPVVGFSLDTPLLCIPKLSYFLYTVWTQTYLPHKVEMRVTVSNKHNTLKERLALSQW